MVTRMKKMVMLKNVLNICSDEVKLSFVCFEGHVALPGGRTDEVNINDIRTALQEVKEEIRLDSASVDFITVLEPFVNKVTHFVPI